MNSQDIFDSITDIRDDLINGAKKAPKKQKRWMRKRWTGVVAAGLALAILATIFLRPGGELSAYAVAEAVYPEWPPIPVHTASLPTMPGGRV